MRFQHTATRRWLQSRFQVACWPAVFQHTATRRWLPSSNPYYQTRLPVSTHSHPKVAAGRVCRLCGWRRVSTHSHPKVAASVAHRIPANPAVSTHSHPKVAAATRLQYLALALVSTHSHPKVAAGTRPQEVQRIVFQHTATRRWLLPLMPPHRSGMGCFNTQPPEGGCFC